jgi:hypothetical protein
MMVQANVLYEIIAVDSLVNGAIASREAQMSSRWKHSCMKTYASFASPSTLVFIILPSK